MIRRLLLATAIALPLLAPTVASASTIPYNCATCGSHNTAFDITYSLVDQATNKWALSITATYQPAGAGVPDYEYINAIAWKIDGVAFENFTPSITSGPDGQSWMVTPGGLSNSGCTGTGVGFFCADSAGLGASHFAPGSPDTWVFLLDLVGNTPLGATMPISFVAQVTNACGCFVAPLIEETGIATRIGVQPLTETPEPATLLLMGAGLVTIAAQLRKRRRIREL